MRFLEQRVVARGTVNSMIFTVENGDDGEEDGGN
jgi:hypothetical protein